ncbi:MAG: competence type IV pilus major pilin ComGC [Liquorilactobacillus satsumensis]
MKKVKKAKVKVYQAFTLVEMSIVLFIIGVLILIILPNISSQRERAQNVGNRALSDVVQTQADHYRNEHTDKQNVTLDELKEGSYLSSGQYEQAKKAGITVEE